MSPAPPRLHAPLARRATLLCLLACVLLSSAAWGNGWSSMLRLEKEGVVVVGTASDALMAVSLQDGRVLWSHPLADAGSARLLSHGSRVVAVTPAGSVTAVDARNGAPAWTLPERKASAAVSRIAGDTLLLSTQVDKKGRLEAIDLANGSVRWSAPWQVVAVLPADPGAALVLCQEEDLVARVVSLADGQPKAPPTPVPGTLKGQPVEAGGGLLLFSTERKPGHGASTRVTALQRASGTVAWQREFPTTEVDQVSLHRDVVLTHRKDGAIQAWLATSGAPAWERTPASLGLAQGCDVRMGSLAEGTVYVMAQADDAVTLLSLDASSGAEQGRFQGPGSVTAGPWSLDEGKGARVALDQLAPSPAGAKPADPVHRLLLLAPRSLATQWTYDLSEPLEEPPLVSALPAPCLVLRQGENILRLDIGSGKQVAKAAVTGDIDAGPFLLQGNALVGCKDGALRLYDLQQGHVRWSLSTKPWFAKQKMPNLVFVLTLSLLIVTFIYLARGGRRLFIRRISGLAALDEAVGRAAEMGRPILFTTGMYDVDDNQTLSALSILGHVARRAAEYETRIVVPCRWAVAMTSSDEVVKTAFLKAGRPDAYRSDDIRYVSEDQFGYVAGVDGIMLRERPAANFFMGQFFGESLILAETGHTTGAIQIAGTAATAQMPFFVAACDYTLLGEELFAASAYLSEDPLEVGSLKGQDVAKALIIILIIACSVLHPYFPWVRTWMAP